MNKPHPNICLAPMQGLTGSIFRNTFAEIFNGIDWAVTPFLTTFTGTRLKSNQLKEVLAENNAAMPIVPQILSKTAEKFISLAKLLFDMGYTSVNWNLGCPFAKVAKKGRGSGLLPYPDQIDAFLEAVVPAIPNQLSIKTRLGRQRPEEIFDLMPVFNRYPLHNLIIHPRTGVQMYAGRPDLESFATCLHSARIPVIYNGDINIQANLAALQQRFPGLETWMIGRGVVANPFLPGAIKGKITEPRERIERFRAFHDVLFERLSHVRFGPAHLVDSLKGYWTYFAASFAQGELILKQVRKSRSIEQYRQAVDRFFDTVDPESSFVA